MGCQSQIVPRAVGLDSGLRTQYAENYLAPTSICQVDGVRGVLLEEASRKRGKVWLSARTKQNYFAPIPNQDRPVMLTSAISM
jgi:hypothetical protein